MRAEALELIKDYRWGPLFTRPSEEGTVHLPGLLGGNNWAAWHPGTGMLYVPSRTMPSLAILNRIDDEASHTRYSADRRTRLSGPRGLPLFKPPYGRVTAIDMGTGEHRWMRPLGRGPVNHPALADHVYGRRTSIHRRFPRRLGGDPARTRRPRAAP